MVMSLTKFIILYIYHVCYRLLSLYKNNRHNINMKNEKNTETECVSEQRSGGGRV